MDGNPLNLKKLEWSDLQPCEMAKVPSSFFLSKSSWKNNPVAISQISGFMLIDTKKAYTIKGA